MKPKSISTSTYINYKQVSSSSVQNTVATYQVEVFDVECIDENMLPEDINKKNNIQEHSE